MKLITTSEPIVMMPWSEFAELLKELPASRVKHYIRNAGFARGDIEGLMNGSWENLERKLICEMEEQL